MLQHVIQSGETLWKVAQKYGISLDALAAANPQIQDPHRLQPGMVINIPVPQAPGQQEIKPIAMKPELLRMRGISEKQIADHFNILYLGYVTKINEIRRALRTADRQKAHPTYSEYRSLRVEESFAMNGVKYHENYFENLGGPGGQPAGLLGEAINRSFGSFQAWQEDFLATGTAARGWAVLTFDYRDRSLHNYLLDAHHIGVIVEAEPILVLDVYEHAYFIDYGARRKPYLDAFMANVDWRPAEQRYLHAASRR